MSEREREGEGETEKETESDQEKDRERRVLLHTIRTLSGGQERELTAALALKAKLSADTGLSAGSPLPL